MSYIFTQVPLLLSASLSFIVAAFLLSFNSGWSRMQLLWLIFTLAMVGALAHGEVSDILFSLEWTLPFFAAVLALVILIPIWGFKLVISLESWAVILAVFFLFLDTNLLLSNALGITIYLFLWVIFLRGTYLIVRQWYGTPTGKE